MHHFGCALYEKPLSACQYSAPTVIKWLSRLLCSKVACRLSHSLPQHLFILSAVSCLEHFISCEWKYVGQEDWAEAATVWKHFKPPHLSVPRTGLRSPAGKFLSGFFLPAHVWSRKKKKKKPIVSEPHQHTRGVNSHTPNTEIAVLKNVSRHHNRASQSDDALGFNQPSPTHQRRGLACYLWQLSLLPGVVTMVSAGCDYPLVGLAPLHRPFHCVCVTQHSFLTLRC